MTTMLAARFHVPGEPLRLEGLDRPSATADEVRVRVEAAGVCGTDLQIRQGTVTPPRSPITLGHEVAGIVDQVGPDVTDLELGDRVVVHHLFPCGDCESCRLGYDNICDTPRGFLSFSSDGGFAEYVVAPRSAVLRVPDGISAAEAAPLCCSGATALHAIRAANAQLGETAVVYGCGGVGLSLVRLLVAGGVRTVAVSRSAEKLAAAEALGAQAAISPADEADGGVAPAVRSAAGPADVVFDVVGSEASGRDGLGSLRKRGRLVLVGHGPEQVAFRAIQLIATEQTIVGSAGSSRGDLRDTLELAQRGVLEVRHRCAPLTEANEVLDELQRGSIVGRAVLIP